MNRFLVLIAATLVSFGAFAQDPAQATPLSFEALDKDADQKLTASEAISDAGLAKNFAAADTDQDGYISRDEFNTYHEQG